MASHAPNSSRLSESQQVALATLTSVTNQEPSDAIPLLLRSDAYYIPTLRLPNSTMLNPLTQVTQLVQLFRPLPHPPSLHTEKLFLMACPRSRDQMTYLLGSQLHG